MRKTLVRFLAVVFAVSTAHFAFAAERSVDLTASDGAKLKASFFPASKPGPGVLLLHQCNRDRHTWDGLAAQLSAAGLVLSGTSPDKRLVEMVELREHPFFVGCQFHPEFKSRPLAPHPLFARFVRAALERQAVRGRTEVRKQAESQPAIN